MCTGDGDLEFNKEYEAYEGSWTVLKKSHGDCHPPRFKNTNNVKASSEALIQALIALSSLNAESALDGSEINEFVEFFTELYGGEKHYRHMYSDICHVMYEFLESDPTKLDDGVPYQARSLANNIGLIYREINGREDIDDQVKRSVYKLYDHIELENTRMKYMAMQNRAQADGVRRLHGEVDTVEKRAEEIKTSLEKDFTDVQDRLQRNYITILGIFAAIVIAFATGSAFSGSVLQSMETVGIYRLSFVMLTIGLFLFDLVATLYLFICRVSKFGEGENLPKIIKLVNAIFIVGIVLTMIFRCNRLFG